MRCCRTLYIAGVPYILRRRIHLTRYCIHSFHKFMLSNTPTSYLALRELSLDFNSLNTVRPKTVGRLLDILTAAVQLRALTLKNGILTLDPRIPDIIASLPQLHQLIFQNEVLTESDNLLRHLRSPLEEVTAVLSDNSDPISTLSAFCHSLLRAQITTNILSSTEHIYPNLRDLHLRIRHYPCLRTLTHAFPNVRRLHLDCYYFELGPHVETLRRNNLASQRNARWDHLEFLQIRNYRALYFLGLQSQVDHLEISGDIYDGDEERSMLCASLSHLHPRRMELQLCTEDLHFASLSEILGVGMERLEHLKFSWCIYLAGRPPEMMLVSAAGCDRNLSDMNYSLHRMCYSRQYDPLISLCSTSS